MYMDIFKKYTPTVFQNKLAIRRCQAHCKQRDGDAVSKRQDKANQNPVKSGKGTLLEMTLQ